MELVHSGSLNDEYYELTESQLYEKAVMMFRVGDYSMAVHLFKLLILKFGVNAEYVKCLAGSLHANGELMVAGFWYNYAYSIDTLSHGECLYYSALVSFEGRDFVTAQNNFNKFLQQCKHVSYEKMIKKSKLYLEVIEFKLKQESGCE